MFSLTLIFFLASIHRTFAASQIALFTDNNCEHSLRGLEGPNGYPNGTCTDLRRNGPYGSFQVVGLDPGCAVTIYVSDTTVDMCSGHQEEIQMIDCYNSTYVYYSIDFCDANVGDESPSLSVSLSPSSSASSTASSPPQASTGPSTGTIVGAVVGGVAGLGLVIGAVLYYIRRRRRTEEMHEAQLGPPDLLMRYEVHGDNRQELPSGTGFYKNHAAVEIEQPPTELPGSDMRQVDGGRFR